MQKADVFLHFAGEFKNYKSMSKGIVMMSEHFYCSLLAPIMQFKSFKTSLVVVDGEV
jgi:hypothetical protein